MSKPTKGEPEQGGAVGVLLNTDAAFIAATRNALPRLLAELVGLRAERKDEG